MVTGRGLITPIGNEHATVTTALRAGKSGIRHLAEYAELGFRSQVAGQPDISREPAIERKLRRFMGDAACFAYHATRRAIEDAMLSSAELQHPRTGVIVGSGVGSPHQHWQAIETFRTRGIDRLPPYYVPQVMGSTTSAALTQAFKIQGPSYSITSACASSAHCIGNAFEQIRHGILDRVIVGGAEELAWTSTLLFDAMGALSSRWNDQPEMASRPFDCDRDGFVIAGGAGILILEAEDIARARKAPIFGEVAGFSASSDGGQDMVQPSQQSIVRAMKQAMQQAGVDSVDYINPHATSTQLGDAVELAALRELFHGTATPAISATKGLTGHAIAASGAQEAIYCLLMMEHGFIAGSANLITPDTAGHDLDIPALSREKEIANALSNSIGFGGTSASLFLRRAEP